VAVADELERVLDIAEPLGHDAPQRALHADVADGSLSAETAPG
jgi:hypothetical protein